MVSTSPKPSSHRSLALPVRGESAQSSNMALFSPQRSNVGLPRRFTPNSRKGSAASVTTLRDRYGSPQLQTGMTGVGMETIEEGSWEGMDPDEVFRRLTVKEVKKVEAKLRTDAENKQGELRTTVGERYRDLLLSTSQITSLRISSLRLSQIIKDVAEACQHPGGVKGEITGKDAGPAKQKDAAAEPGDGIEIVNQLPIAAHMKLLLDAPESLYGFLSTESYLEAAYLWLLARMVKENLESMAGPAAVTGEDGSASPDDVDPSRGKAFLPLVQKQWDTLAPFRAQIVKRATAALQVLPTRAKGQSKKGQSIEDVAKTLLSIILLDSNTVQEVLSLFLHQRFKALQHLLEDGSIGSSRFSPVRSAEAGAPPVIGSTLNRKGSRRDRSDRGHSRKGSTKLNAAAVLRELSPAPNALGQQSATAEQQDATPATTQIGSVSNRQDEIRKARHKAKTVRTFVDIARCLRETLHAVRAIFVAHEADEGRVSLLEEMMKNIQEVVPANKLGRTRSNSHPTSQMAGPTAHRRRTSRLASISLSLAPPTVAALRQQTGLPDVNTGHLNIVTTQTILEALPSSQILLNFLPPSIQGFAPFIPPSSGSTGGATGDIGIRLAQWFDKALAFVGDSAEKWLEGLSDIRDVWSVRASVEAALQAGMDDDDVAITSTETLKLHRVLQNSWEFRIRSIWNDKLQHLVDGLHSKVHSALSVLSTDTVRADLEMRPSQLYFSADLTFPPPPTSTLFSSGTSASSFETYHLPGFRKALQQRRDARTPLMDNILAEVEAISTSIHADLSVLPGDTKDGLLSEYGRAAQQALVRIIESLETLGNAYHSLEGKTAASLFLARLATQIAHNHLDASICGSSALLDTDAGNEDFRRRLLAFHGKMVAGWRKQVVDGARRILKESRVSADGPLSTGISLGLQSALNDIVKALLNLGMPVSSEVSKLEAEVTREFAKEALEMLGDSRTPDAALLRQLANNGDDQTGYDVISLTENAKKRNQLLLAPILRQLRQKAPSKGARQSLLLPFGSVNMSHDYVSPLVVAKPAQRFGMLSTV